MHLNIFLLMLLGNFVKKDNLFIKNENNNICINCIHYIERVKFEPYNCYINENLPQCKKFKTMNIVTGEIDYELAITCRNNIDKCNINSIFFEKKTD